MLDTLVQIAAAVGPVMLAVMGVWVSIRPPSPYGRAHWLWAASFVLVGVITAVALFRELRSSEAVLDRIWEVVSSPQSSTNHTEGPNKYVCITGSKITDNSYVMLVEFGVYK